MIIEKFHKTSGITLFVTKGAFGRKSCFILKKYEIEMKKRVPFLKDLLALQNYLVRFCSLLCLADTGVLEKM